MADIRVSAFFRPWNNGASDELAGKQNTGDGDGSERFTATSVEEENNRGRLTSASRGKENDATVKRRVNSDCMLSVSKKLFETTENVNRRRSGKSPSSIGASSPSCSMTSENGNFNGSVAASPEATLCSSATDHDSSSPAATSSSAMPEDAWSTECPADYLRKTGLYHAMAYPTLSMGSVIWPMGLVPTLETSMVQSTGQPFYYGHPGHAGTADGLYPLSIEHAAGMIQRQEEAAKVMKKLRPKRFRCEHCDVAFSNNGQLKGHVRIHTGERPFKCDAEGCEKSFTRNEELTRHKRIHTGVRPHACLVCGKCFGRKDHLKKHTRTHENRDLYATSAAALGMYALGHAAPPFPPYVFHI